MKIIEYKGKTIETKNFSELTDEQCEQLRKDFYAKPSIDEVRDNLAKIYEGSTKISDITNYYFKDLMAKVRLHHSKWSLEELFECNDLIRYVHGKTLTNKKIFPDKDSEIKKIETAIRLSGKGSASKPTNFPIKIADRILDKYNINNIYYDMSCGWGVRLLSALRHNITYIGTDPNKELIDRLKAMTNEYNSVNNTKLKPLLFCKGSEETIYEMVSKVGLCFSSIPFFNLEIYKSDNQSYKEGMEYDEWKEHYLKPTINNCYQYLIDGGHMIINVKNFKKYKLEEDTISLAKECGFEFVEKLPLQEIRRTKSSEGFHSGIEGLFVFKKN